MEFLNSDEFLLNESEREEYENWLDTVVFAEVLKDLDEDDNFFLDHLGCGNLE
jgi:hypothetical protein